MFSPPGLIRSSEGIPVQERLLLDAGLDARAFTINYILWPVHAHTTVCVETSQGETRTSYSSRNRILFQDSSRQPVNDRRALRSCHYQLGNELLSEITNLPLEVQ